MFLNRSLLSLGRKNRGQLLPSTSCSAHSMFPHTRSWNNTIISPWPHNPASPKRTLHRYLSAVCRHLSEIQRYPFQQLGCPQQSAPDLWAGRERGCQPLQNTQLTAKQAMICKKLFVGLVHLQNITWTLKKKKNSLFSRQKYQVTCSISQVSASVFFQCHKAL